MTAGVTVNYASHINTWMKQAACVDAPLTVFFPEKPAPINLFYKIGKEYCATCPVLAQCRKFVDDMEGTTEQGNIAGLYAGETPQERRNRRNKNK